MAHLYIRIVRVDARLLRGRAVEPLGARGEELVERVGRRYKHRSRKAAAPPRAPYLLPRGGDAARIAVQHREAERADVYAELERVRRDDALQRAAAEVGLDFAPLLRQVAAAVAHNHHRVRAALR